MNIFKRSDFIPQIPLWVTLSSVLLVSFSLSGCDGSDGEIVVDSGSGDESQDLSGDVVPIISNYSSPSCVSPDIYKDDDLFVNLDSPYFMSNANNDNLLAKAAFASAGAVNSNMFMALVYCDFDRANENGCDTDINFGGQTASTQGTASVDGKWVSFTGYNIDDSEVVTPVYTFRGESPMYWKGSLTANNIDGSTSTIKWSRNAAGDEHYEGTSTNGQTLEFDEKTDCSGTMSSYMPDNIRFEITWLPSAGDKVIASYTLCDLSGDAEECVTKENVEL